RHGRNIDRHADRAARVRRHHPVQLDTDKSVYRLLLDCGRQADNGVEQAGNSGILFPPDTRSRIQHQVQWLRQVHSQYSNGCAAAAAATASAATAAATAAS